MALFFSKKKKNMSEISVTQTLNTLGLLARTLSCVVPKNIRHLNDGEILLIIADDPAATRDIPSFCQFMDHTLLQSEVEKPPFKYWVKRGGK